MTTLKYIAILAIGALWTCFGVWLVVASLWLLYIAQCVPIVCLASALGCIAGSWLACWSVGEMVEIISR